MSSSSCMYTIKPVIGLSEEIELPKCMYTMRNIQKSLTSSVPLTLLNSANPVNNNSTKARSVLEQVNDFLKKPLPEMQELELRQEAILEQLAQLKQQVSTLKANLSKTVSTNTATTVIPQLAAKQTTRSTKKTPSDISPTYDVVIYVNPKYPPYSLVALFTLWGSKTHVKVSLHTHSSVTDVPSELKNFLRTDWGATTDQSLPIVKVSVVWKDVGIDPELVVSPLRRIALRGEVNILRYLSHLGDSKYDYCSNDDPAALTNLDRILDVCHGLSWSRLVKEKQALVRVLNGAIGKSQYLLGNEVSIADVAAWSALKKISEQSVLADLSANMVKWQQRCNLLFQ